MTQSTAPKREGVLAGMKVLSFCHYLQGPACTQYLSDMGADIVKIEPEANPPTDTVAGETYPWIRIRTLDDQPVYVFGKYVRSPLGYRAGFQKIDGEWRLTFFVTGD